MKLKDAVVGKYVFLKKSAPEYTGVERAFLIRDIVHNKGGSTKAVLEDENKIDLCKLTDVPCSQMKCGKCKYHNRRKKR